jgi:hypothetical protein
MKLGRGTIVPTPKESASGTNPWSEPMFNVRRNAFSPWLHVEPPPPDEPPGFRVAADGSVRDTQGTGFAPFEYDPRDGAASPAGTSFEDAIRLASGGLHSPADLATLPRSPVQEALDQIARNLRRLWHEAVQPA